MYKSTPLIAGPALEAAKEISELNAILEKAVGWFDGNRQVIPGYNTMIPTWYDEAKRAIRRNSREPLK